MSLDGVQSDEPQTRIPRSWCSRDRLVLTILRSPGMMGSALFLILMFGGVGYTSFSSMLEEGEGEEFLNTYYPPIMTARGSQIPGLRGVGVSGLAGARRVALAWRQIVDWAEYKGYLRQGDTRPGVA